MAPLYSSLVLDTPADILLKHLGQQFAADGFANPSTSLRHCVAGRNGYTAFHVVPENGDDEMADLLLSARPTKVMTRALTTLAVDGESPLSVAAGNGHSAVVSCLLGAEAKHRVSIMGSCALRSAIRFGHDGVVRLLLDNIDAVGGLAELPMLPTCASLRGRVRTLNMLLSVEGEKKWRGSLAKAFRCSPTPPGTSLSPT